MLIYKEQKQNVDVENVILKSWQESLLNYMKPSDREIFGFKVDIAEKEKPGFKNM